MLELALQYKSAEPVRIRKIGERHNVPPRFLVQILLQLKGAGLVSSVRGAAGGYQLLKPPAEISLGQIMDVIDGLLAEDCQTSTASPDSPAVKALGQVWRRRQHAAEHAQRHQPGRVGRTDEGERRGDVSHLKAAAECKTLARSASEENPSPAPSLAVLRASV